ncbi:protein kinase domain-containing protein [Citrus sinensis]|nr:protein kinase domain-containing protein [Citrus sinensis]
MTSIMWPSLVIGINFIVLIISQLCLAASLSTVANATSTCSNETDKIALLAFKDFITEDPLGILSSWNDSVHLCEWQGVKRSSRDWRDVELNLRSQKLADSFTNLSTKLRILDAGGNQFAGDIPAGMPKYFNLIQLGLDRNCLSGNIPESLENLTSLQILNLSCNQLGGSIPKPSGLFSTLSSIDFAHNNFNGSLPLEVGSLSNTQELDFSEHMLSGTIDLNLSHNNLSGTIPKELETLPFLENLNLSFNNFEGQLPSMSVFTNTSVISIVGNGKLCGGVPELRLLSCAIESSKKQIHHLGSSMDSGGNDFKALAFEFMPSGSLESWLHPNEATRRLDLAEGLKIAVDIVAAFGLSSSPLRNTNCSLFLPTNVTNPMKGQSNSAAVWGSIGYVPPGKRPTDEMFADCLSLHNFCKMALPERVMELVYSRLLQGVDKDAEDEPCMKAKIRECLTSLGRIGIASLTETPNERMGVREMVMEMNVIKEVLLGVRINGERRIRKNATN